MVFADSTVQTRSILDNAFDTYDYDDSGPSELLRYTRATVSDVHSKYAVYIRALCYCTSRNFCKSRLDDVVICCFLQKHTPARLN